MFKIVNIFIILVIISGCSLRPNLEEKKDYMDNLIKVLNETNQFKDYSYSDNKILYNKKVLGIDIGEFIRLLHNTIEDNYNLKNIVETDFKFNKNTSINKEIEKRITYFIEDNKRIECIVLMEKSLQEPLKQSLNCIKK
jgi:hypothetical protein